MSILSTSTKVRAAGKAVTVPAKVARRLPESRSSRRRLRRIESLAVTAARAADSARRHQRRQRHPVRTAAGVATAAGGTALAVYLLDRDQGRRRRHELRDRSAKALRQAGRRGASEAKHATGAAKGAIASVTPAPDEPQVNDPAAVEGVQGVESLLDTSAQPAEPKPETLDSSARHDTEAARRRSES